MTSKSQLLADENGIEIIVDYEQEESKVIEDDNYASTLVYTELKSFEVVIKGRGIDILNLLTEYQKKAIIENLQPC